MAPDSPAPSPIRVLVVDDHPAVREGLALLLAPEGIAVCAEAGNRSEAMALVERHCPDLVLVDLSLAGEDGVSVVADLHAASVPPLVYSMHEDTRHVQSALAAGALGYVTKRELHRVLVRAIREVAAGRRFLSSKAASALAEHLAGSNGGNAEVDLSEQERQVYRLLGEGEGTIEIAAALDVSTRTVESYYSRLQGKLGLTGMRALRRHAIRHLHEHNP